MRLPTLLLAALCALPLACKPAGASGFNPDGLAGPRIDPPLPKPDFALPATDGKPFDFRKETEGYVTLLFFGYTHCPDVCPVQMANVSAALSTLSPEINNAVKVVFVTTDPERDTPPVLRAWLNKFDPQFIGLIGDSATVARTSHALHMPPPEREALPDGSGYGIGHAAFVVAFTRDNLAHVVYPFGIRQADWARDLKILTRAP
ncbi:MAG TPA: SCO family protein [Gemmatimonadales bacterium]|nr:SCO family protein [Gemmatimonadales bacterium]